jgi:methyl-accepting chemotaxis protein
MTKFSLRTKFTVGLATIIVVSIVILWGNRLLGKGALFHYLERMHLENVMLMDKAFTLAEQEARNANELRRADLLHYIDAASALAIRADGETVYVEKVLLRLLGYGDILDLPKKALADLDRIRAVIVAAPGDGISAGLAARVRVNRQEIIRNSNQFATLTLEAVHLINTIVYTLSTLAVIALVLLICLLRQSTLPAIAKALEIAKRIAQGDLTGKIQAHDHDEFGELLQALQTMNENLAGIVGEVREGAESFSNVSREIAAGNADLSSRTDLQAIRLEQTASSLKELTRTVQKNAENAAHASDLALASSEVAKKGGVAVSQIVSTMNSIKESSRQVADIVSVIDGLAAQTNILALNAAVEAARAGEAGRGFAVVASEVRTLAQRSAHAAKEIKVLIQNAVDKTDAGSILVGEAGGTMEEVVTSVDRVASLIGEIACASREQSTGIEQVDLAISEMNRVTQQNAALVEQAAAATFSLQDRAVQLTRRASAFRLGDRPGLPVLLLK